MITPKASSCCSLSKGYSLSTKDAYSSPIGGLWVEVGLGTKISASD